MTDENFLEVNADASFLSSPFENGCRPKTLLCKVPTVLVAQASVLSSSQATILSCEMTFNFAWTKAGN
jgi:hypothetical protein